MTFAPASSNTDCSRTGRAMAFAPAPLECLLRQESLCVRACLCGYLLLTAGAAGRCHSHLLLLALDAAGAIG
jgi:hypothetical protein